MLKYQIFNNVTRGIGERADRVVITTLKGGLVCKNNRVMKHVNALLIKLGYNDYLIFKYGKELRGIMIESLGNTLFRWDAKFDIWRVNISASTLNKAKRVDIYIPISQQNNIVMVLKDSSFHKKAYQSEPSKYRRVTVHASELIGQFHRLYDLVDSRAREYMYKLDGIYEYAEDSTCYRYDLKFSQGRGKKPLVHAGLRAIYDGVDAIGYMDDGKLWILPYSQLVLEKCDYDASDRAFTLHMRHKDEYHAYEFPRQDTVPYFKRAMETYGHQSLPNYNKIENINNLWWFQSYRRLNDYYEEKGDRVVLSSIYDINK